MIGRVAIPLFVLVGVISAAIDPPAAPSATPSIATTVTGP
jgi:hypothetical protein